MSVAEFLALFAGIVTELLLLLGPWMMPQVPSRFVDALPYRQTVLTVGGSLLLLALALNQFEVTSRPYMWMDSLITPVAVGALLILLAAGIFANGILPRVNEQQMLIIHLLVGANLVINGVPSLPVWALWGMLLPTVGLLFQAFWPRPLPVSAQSGFYLWYLVTLLLLAAQNGSADYFNAIELSTIDVFIFGSLLIFLGVHILFAARFVILVSSAIVPRNRLLLQLVLPTVMSDDQTARPVLAAVLGGVVVLYFVNAAWGLVLDQTAINVMTLFVIQFGGRYEVAEADQWWCLIE
ncbi:MAG: hypothetical protein R2873_35885 [Caldilineaceae bacterium]